MQHSGGSHKKSDWYHPASPDMHQKPVGSQGSQPGSILVGVVTANVVQARPLTNHSHQPGVTALTNDNYCAPVGFDDYGQNDFYCINIAYITD